MPKGNATMSNDTQALKRRTILGGAVSGAALAASSWKPARAQAPVTISLAVWGAQAEEDAFNAAIKRYQQLRPNVTVKLEVAGNSGQLYQQVDTRLAGRQAPDLFRVQYQQLGRYAAARAIIDVGKYLDSGYEAGFLPAFWQAVSHKGRPVALPHHTDTFAVYTNRELMAKIGEQAPASLDKSWSWAEFIRISRALKEKGGAPFGFAMSWQNGAAYRWMPFLYQHGGQMLNADATASQLSSKAGVETIAWTQSWFKEGLVPPSTSIKSSEAPQNLFANGTIGMLIGGDWQIPFLTKNMKAEWDVTYMPRDVGMASDLGGNAIAISRDCKNPDAAADFLKFMVDEQNMEAFVTAAQFLPVRKGLAGRELDYKLRPEAMGVFVRQASTIPVNMVTTQTLPNFAKINARLTDELDLAFTSGQDATTTARNIDSQVQPLLAS
jgi:multiple sugar transport system substrate-binding protein